MVAEWRKRKTLRKTIDSTVKDEDIKKETKDIINKVSKEIQENLKDVTQRFTLNERLPAAAEEEIT